MALELGSDAERGLDAEEARGRLAQVGPNELHSGEKVRPGHILVGQLTSPMLLLLSGAAVLAAVLGKAPEALVIFVVVVLNAWIGFRQEYRAERAMASLRAMATPTVKVLRDGAPQELPAREVVPGDVVLLEAGANVPADGRLAESHSLRVDESALTGESAPVHKRIEAVAASAPLAERASMAYSGTSVTAGRGKLVVSATGTATELGHVADLLEGADAGRTPLQLRLDKLVKHLALFAGVIVLLVFGLGLLRGEELDTLLLTAVSLAVAAIPESLPAVVTITLALGAQRMLVRKALIRRLYAVETLGSVTAICSDKTGTMTQNRMTIVVLDMAGDRRMLDAERPDADDLREQPTLRLLLAGGALCNDTVVSDDGSLLGDPTETALVAVAQRYGLDKGDLEAALPREFELPFDSERKRMTTVHALPARTEDVPEPLRVAFGDVDAQVGIPDRLAFTKGAVDGLLAQCDSISVDGSVLALDESLRRRALDAAEELAADGVRVLGVAMRRWPD
ncbi:MAG: HAD-IC family P-type ATPase, partial [Actinobacteria bacterium]|nr:HAD-IC family P-type ATPase [Actinomycetota bacterium]